MKYDIIVVGGGPAGLSAAIFSRVRNQNVLVITNQITANPLCKAPRIDNYPGLSRISGLDLMEKLISQSLGLGVAIHTGRVLSVSSAENRVMVSAGSDLEEGGALILATGVSRSAPLSGEQELLGRGVSYCAVCDGRLYRGRHIIVSGDAPDLGTDADYLRQIGCQVTEVPLPGLKILGDTHVTGVRTALGEEIPCDGVFLLRATLFPDQLLPGLDLEDGHIKVSRRMETSLPGIFAAGDCTGEPLQLAKAVGEGQMAAHSAISYLIKRKEEL